MPRPSAMPMVSGKSLQFQTADLVAPATYELSNLLRVQAGTDGAMDVSLPAGARFVFLDHALAPVDMSLDDIGLAFNWRFGPASRDIGHPSYVAPTHTFAGAGLRPYSPVHVRGSRDPAATSRITWTRRTRIGGDAWSAGDVPLARGKRALRDRHPRRQHRQAHNLHNITIRHVFCRRPDRRLRRSAVRLHDPHPPDRRRLRPRHPAHRRRLSVVRADIAQLTMPSTVLHALGLVPRVPRTRLPRI